MVFTLIKLIIFTSWVQGVSLFDSVVVVRNMCIAN